MPTATLSRPEPPASGEPPSFTAADFAAATSATPQQLADLETFRSMLLDWSGRMNLIGPATKEQFWDRHALDSAQLLDHAPDARTWADLGAGAGFPGLVLAILLRERPGAHVHLVESLAKRCRFLQAVVEALALPVTVHNARAEAMTLAVDVVTARAVAPLNKLLGFAAPSLAQGGIGLFLKGAGAEAELAEVRRSWRFRAELSPSRTSGEGRVVRIEGLAHAR